MLSALSQYANPMQYFPNMNSETGTHHGCRIRKWHCFSDCLAYEFPRGLFYLWWVNLTCTDENLLNFQWCSEILWLLHNMVIWWPLAWKMCLWHSIMLSRRSRNLFHWKWQRTSPSKIKIALISVHCQKYRHSNSLLLH